MVGEDIDGLRNTLKRALEFAMDASGNRTWGLSLRKEEARFYGITSGWQEGLRNIERDGRKLIAELAAATPSAVAVVEDLAEPLECAERALEKLLSAIVDVELEEPASVLWERERDETIDQLERMKSGEARSANCTICGIPFLEDPDRLREHFEHHHKRPGPGEHRLVPVSQQLAAVKAESKAFRAAYEEAISSLTSHREAAVAAEQEPSRGGARPHPWRDIMGVMIRKRFGEGKAAESRRKEARRLLEWAQKIELPLDPDGKKPSGRTVEGWVGQEWPQ